MPRFSTGVGAMLMGAWGLGWAVADPPMTVMNPSNSGIPGEEVRVVRWGPDGNPWVAARWIFWQDGGIARYDRATDVWTVWSKGEYPLPSEYINDFEWDAAGVMWIATDRGLVRWDGQSWTTYDPSNSPMALYKVLDVSVAPDGHIWINNSDSNFGGDAIYDFDGVSTWRRFRVPTELPWPSPWTDLSSVLVDHLGHVWVANDTQNGLAEYDGASWTLRGSAVGRFDGLAEDPAGNIWMRAGAGGANAFYKYNRVTFTTYPIGAAPLSIGIDDDGTVYTGDWNGVMRKTSNAGQSWTIYLSGLNPVAQIAPDAGSTDVWIGTFGALGHFRGDGTWVRDFNTWNTGFPDYFVDYMNTDRDGYFWVATGEAGLSRFDGLRWRNWGAHNAGSEPYPFAGNEPMGGAYQDRNGVHWFGGNGIARWHSDTGLFDGFWNWQNNPGMGVTLFPFFAEDGSGRLFAAAESGATYHFDDEVNLWVREPVNPYAPFGLPGMTADRQGNVWIAAWFDVHKWDGTAWSLLPLPYSNYFFDLGGINDLAVDPDGSLWFGTDEGLVHYDGAAFTLYNQTNTPLPAASITGIDIRADGVIGLAASDFGAQTPFPNGVCVIEGDISDPGNWTIYQYGKSPLPHYQLGRVRWDAQGRLWVSAISEGAAIVHWPAPGIDGDLDGDGDVDLADLSRLLSAFAACQGDAGFDAGADIDGDGCVSLADLSALLTNFGAGA